MPVCEVHRILRRIRKQPIDLGPEILGADSSLCMAGLSCSEIGVILADQMTAL